MKDFNELFKMLIINNYTQIIKFLLEIGPKILFAGLVLLIGWVLALIIKKITATLLKALGLNILSKKSGLKSILDKGGIIKELSLLVGYSFYWAIIFSVLIMAFKILELEIAIGFIKRTLTYIPGLIIAGLLFSLAMFIGSYIDRFVTRLANLPLNFVWGKITRYLVIGLATMIIMEYVGIERTYITKAFSVLFIGIPFIIILMLGIGGRDILSNILASVFVRLRYQKGMNINIENMSGVIASIDLINTTVKNGSTEVIIPNSELLKKYITKIDHEI